MGAQGLFHPWRLPRIRGGDPSAEACGPLASQRFSRGTATRRDSTVVLPPHPVVVPHIVNSRQATPERKLLLNAGAFPHMSTVCALRVWSHTPLQSPI